MLLQIAKAITAGARLAIVPPGSAKQVSSAPSAARPEMRQVESLRHDQHGGDRNAGARALGERHRARIEGDGQVTQLHAKNAWFMPLPSLPPKLLLVMGRGRGQAYNALTQTNGFFCYFFVHKK